MMILYNNVEIYLQVDILPTCGGAVVVVIALYLDLHLPVHSVSITSKVVSSNPVHGELYSMQHYVVNFVSDLRQVGSFLHQ